MATAYFISHPDVQIDPAQPSASGLRTIWCSTERKARDGAEILAEGSGLPLRELAALGENDQPPNNGGNCDAFEIQDRRLYHDWKAIDLFGVERSGDQTT